ncbi:MAG: DUF2007 domain-containing protein [Bacteroidota bacterium]
MNNWKIIITFTYPHEAHLAKVKLESEDIPVQIRDELTAQVNNFYSNAIGGVKLLVQEKDFSRALELLIESGQIIKTEQSGNKFLSRFDKISSKLPLIGKSIPELRLIIIVAFLLIVIITPIAIMSLPSTVEKLTKNSWCVEKIYYKGQELIPNSYGLKMVSDYDNCREIMRFREDGIVDLPGINSYGYRMRWEFKNDTLKITEWNIGNNYPISENLEKAENEKEIKKSIFHGNYILEITGNRIKLQSDSLIILGKVDGHHFMF